MPGFMSKQLEKHETYFKNAENSSCVDVDLALMNQPQSFQKSIVFETGLSKFHKQLTVTSLSNTFPNKNPRLHRDYQNFQNNKLRAVLEKEI